MQRLPTDRAVSPEFFDAEYFLAGTVSNYKPYGPGDWVEKLTGMIVEYLRPTSVLDVGCAYGYMVESLGQQGIPAYGFDISPYAYAHRTTKRIWQGDAGDPAAYQVEADLVMATELVEHLIESQALVFLRESARVGKRLLILGVFEHEPEPGDASHIRTVPMSWWAEAARGFGWNLADASALNEDARSVSMAWNGRFMLFDKLVQPESDGDSIVPASTGRKRPA